jgi:PBP1b-binding outer membrane lipoprotein LpoB
MRRLLLLVLLIGGCSNAEAPQKNSVPLDKVPSVVMDAAVKAAKEKFPDLKFESAWKKPTGVYEIVGKTKSGKTHDVEVKESGEITEVE